MCAYKARRLPCRCCGRRCGRRSWRRSTRGRWSGSIGGPRTKPCRVLRRPDVFVSRTATRWETSRRRSGAPVRRSSPETQGGVGVGQGHRGTARVDRSHLRRRAGGRRGHRGENVLVPPVDPTAPRRCGRARLFRRPHPPADARGPAPRRCLVARTSTSSEHRDEPETLRGRDHIALASSPDALVRALEPATDAEAWNAVEPDPEPKDERDAGPDADSDERDSDERDSDSDEGETTSFLSSSAARGDVAALGRLFAAMYAPRGGRGSIDALPPPVRSATRRMLSSKRPPTAAAIRDSTLFPPRIRSAAASLAAIRVAPAGVARVEAAAEALATGAGRRSSSSPPPRRRSATPYDAPAKREDRRGRRRGGGRILLVLLVLVFLVARAPGWPRAIFARVARRAPARVCASLLPSLMSSTLTGDVFGLARARRRSSRDPRPGRVTRRASRPRRRRVPSQDPTRGDRVPDPPREASDPDPDSNASAAAPTFPSPPRPPRRARRTRVPFPPRSAASFDRSSPRWVAAPA